MVARVREELAVASRGRDDPVVDVGGGFIHAWEGDEVSVDCVRGMVASGRIIAFWTIPSEEPLFVVAVDRGNVVGGNRFAVFGINACKSRRNLFE